MGEEKKAQPAQGKTTSDEKVKKKKGDGSNNDDGNQGRERTREEDIRRMQKRLERLKGLPSFETEHEGIDRQPGE